MTRVIKVKQSDIAKIVMEVAYGKEFDDFDTKIQPEELTQDPQINPDELEQMGIDPQNVDDSKGRKATPIVIGKDKNGNIGIFDLDRNVILGMK